MGIEDEVFSTGLRQRHTRGQQTQKEKKESGVVKASAVIGEQRLAAAKWALGVNNETRVTLPTENPADSNMAFAILGPSLYSTAQQLFGAVTGLSPTTLFAFTFFSQMAVSAASSSFCATSSSAVKDCITGNGTVPIDGSTQLFRFEFAREILKREPNARVGIETLKCAANEEAIQGIISSALTKALQENPGGLKGIAPDSPEVVTVITEMMQNNATFATQVQQDLISAGYDAVSTIDFPSLCAAVPETCAAIAREIQAPAGHAAHTVTKSLSRPACFASFGPAHGATLSVRVDSAQLKDVQSALCPELRQQLDGFFNNATSGGPCFDAAKKAELIRNLSVGLPIATVLAGLVVATIILRNKSE